MPGEVVLEARDVTVVRDGAPIVDRATLTLAAGEIVGLTGASESGKSTLAYALLGLARPPARIAGGAVEIGGQDLLAMHDQAAAALRGRAIALIVQNPRAALNPMLTVGAQIGRLWRTHRGGGSAEATARAVSMLKLVGINDAERRAASFAHELSGGMAQRALIAAALASEPRILIADEPTSGLDVTVQAQFLDMMWRTAKARNTAMLLVTKEPGVLANYCDRVLTMAGGRIVDEQRLGPRAAAPARRETVAPLAADAAPLVAVENLVKTFPVRGTNKAVHAVSDVSFSVASGETLGLVGESGSGKTTVGRCLLDLTTPDSGRIRLVGSGAADGVAFRRHLRAAAQIVRQDPFDSFNPRWTIGESLREPLRAQARLDDAGQRKRVADLVALVGCAPGVVAARPRDLSGGILQRLAVARALATEPRFVVLDEPTSALPPEARTELIALLRHLQQDTRVSFLFVSHDLTTVAAVSHRVAVMYLGEIVEIGTTEQVFRNPRHPYTRALIAAHLEENPVRRRVETQPREMLQGEIPSPIDLPTGCFLASRCPHVQPQCTAERQRLVTYDAGRQARCWRVPELDAEEMTA